MADLPIFEENLSGEENNFATRNLEYHRAYVSVLADIRDSFYDKPEEELIDAYLLSSTRYFKLDFVRYAGIVPRSFPPTALVGPILSSSSDGTRLIKSSAVPPEYCQSTLSVSETSSCFLARALASGQMIPFDISSRENMFEPCRHFMCQFGIHSCITLPMLLDGNIQGGIVFYSRKRNTFDDTLLEYLQNSVKELSRILESKRREEGQQRSLREAKEKAESAAAVKSQFLANMSHEIRTPMTSIIGYTDLALHENLSILDRPESEPTREEYRTALERCREAAMIVNRSAEYLLSLLNDILDFSKIDVDKMVLEMLEIQLIPFLRETLSLYSLKAEQKNLALKIRGLTLLPEVIHTDPTRLKQVLVNLLGNSIKFTQDGTITLSIAWIGENQEGIGIRLQSDNEFDPTPVEGTLFISVEDTGIGIPSDKLASLFLPFTQIDPSMSRRFGGTGLGLAISKRIAELLNGDLNVSSQLGEGSTFTISLPLRFPTGNRWKFIREISGKAINTVSAPGKRSADLTDFPLDGLRILLAEDAHDNRRLFSLILKKAGAIVEEAENGALAVEIVNAVMPGEPQFDLILMDMQMPVMDGYTATTTLRTLGYTMPIVALTAHAMTIEQNRCLEAGCNDFARKPILRHDLLEVVLKNAKPKTQAEI